RAAIAQKLRWGREGRPIARPSAGARWSPVRYRDQHGQRQVDTVRPLMRPQSFSERGTHTLAESSRYRIQNGTHAGAAGLLPVLVRIGISKPLSVGDHLNLGKARGEYETRELLRLSDPARRFWHRL